MMMFKPSSNRNRFSTALFLTVLAAFVTTFMVYNNYPVMQHYRIYATTVPVVASSSSSSSKDLPSLSYQSYVISFHHQKATGTFRNINSRSGFYDDVNNSTSNTSHNAAMPLAWFPAVNGKDPQVLDEWSTMAHPTFPKIPPNTSKNGLVGPDGQTNVYLSPHVIGCYESHRRLMQLALQGWTTFHTPSQHTNHNDHSHRPDALFIFEDDAVCIDNTLQKTLNVLSQLPKTWEILFIGGKPSSYLQGNPMRSNDELKQDFAVQKLLQQQQKGCQELCKATFRQLACNGTFGVSRTGPFGTILPNQTAQDGRTQFRNDSTSQPYWRVKYLTNTHAYVVNPQRIEHLLDILNENIQIEYPWHNFRPVDVTMADAMTMGRLEAYIISEGELCQQADLSAQPHELRQQQQGRPRPWEGYYHHNMFNYLWEKMYFPECQHAYQQGLL